MSRWQQGGIDSSTHPETGELMLSAADVLAWIRDNATSHDPHGCVTGHAFHALADALADSMLEATRRYVDGSES